jgi:hypothetical protein
MASLSSGSRRNRHSKNGHARLRARLNDLWEGSRAPQSFSILIPNLCDADTVSIHPNHSRLSDIIVIRSYCVDNEIRIRGEQLKLFPRPICGTDWIEKKLTSISRPNPENNKCVVMSTESAATNFWSPRKNTANAEEKIVLIDLGLAFW